jgi:hypothetical protein
MILIFFCQFFCEDESKDHYPTGQKGRDWLDFF